MQSNASKKASAKWFLWLFIGIGVVVIGVGVNLAFQSIRCTSWPTTVGIVRTAKMGRHRGNKGGTTYSADVSYDYSVGGSHYTGTKVAFGMMSASARYAQGVLNRYPVGATVPVHYSPNDPETAVLETGIHGGTGVCFGVGTIFTLFGIMMFQLMKRQPPTPGAPAALTDGTRMNAPPKLMGVIAIMFGAMAIFAGRTSGNAGIAYMAGGMFCLVGLYIIAYRPGDNLLSRWLKTLIGLLFLGIFHWVAFGMGKVEWVFAVFVGAVDLIILVAAAYRLFRSMKVKARGL